MARHFRHPDLEAHEPGCQELESGDPDPVPGGAYIDVFCICHRYTAPKILTNGTDIAWPAGWSQGQADAWRKQNGFAAPLGQKVAVGEPLPQERAQNDPEIVNPITFAEHGLLTDPSNPAQNDEASTT